MTPKTFLLPESFVIPTMPAVAHKVTTMLQNPDVGLREIATVVAQDAPLAAKVLKIANSSFYGLQERCISTTQAASILGAKVLRNVVLQAAVIRQFDHLKELGVDLTQSWRHSIVTAQACQYLVQNSGRRWPLSPDEAYVCGLLHDLGQVVLIDNLREAYVVLWKRARVSKVPLHVLEHQSLGFTHAEVGGRIAQRWNLPTPVMHAISYHHGPESEALRDAVVALILVANLVVERVTDENPVGALEVFASPPGTFLGIPAATQAALIAFVGDALRNVEI